MVNDENNEYGKQWKYNNNKTDEIKEGMACSNQHNNELNSERTAAPLLRRRQRNLNYTTARANMRAGGRRNSSGLPAVIWRTGGIRQLAAEDELYAAGQDCLAGSRWIWRMAFLAGDAHLKRRDLCATGGRHYGGQPGRWSLGRTMTAWRPGIQLTRLTDVGVVWRRKSRNRHRVTLWRSPANWRQSTLPQWTNFADTGRRATCGRLAAWAMSSLHNIYLLSYTEILL